MLTDGGPNLAHRLARSRDLRLRAFLPADQHRVEAQFVADIGAEALNAHPLTFGNAILLAAGGDHRKHLDSPGT